LQLGVVGLVELAGEHPLLHALHQLILPAWTAAEWSG
jgi:hypothetical protein